MCAMITIILGILKAIKELIFGRSYTDEEIDALGDDLFKRYGK